MRLRNYELGMWVADTDRFYHWVNYHRLRYWTRAGAERAQRRLADHGYLSHRVRDMREELRR